MNKSLRKAVIAGNWKMNNTPAETTALINEMKPLVADADCDVIICAPFVDLNAALEAAAGSNIMIGAENCHWAESGAFTGEVSAKMLAAMGVPYVIIGHSERRQYFGETDETVNKRTKAVLAAGMTPIMCIGETLSEREGGITEDVLSRQLEKDLEGVEDVTKVVIAYEPVWAIGTGRTATDEQAQETIAFIRKKIGELFCPKCAEKVIIQYGGSMNAGNCKGLMAQPDIDGGLIGGASLKCDFAKIVNFDK